MGSNTKNIVRAPAGIPRDALCYVCERGGVDMLPMGLGVYRHEDCAPGSTLWVEWYERHPEKHTEAGEVLYKLATEGRTACSVEGAKVC